MASWKCLGAAEDRNHCFLKVKSLKILIFEDSVRSWEGDFRSLKEVQSKEVQVGKEVELWRRLTAKD